MADPGVYITHSAQCHAETDGSVMLTFDNGIVVSWPDAQGAWDLAMALISVTAPLLPNDEPEGR